MNKYDDPNRVKFWADAFLAAYNKQGSETIAALTAREALEYYDDTFHDMDP